MSRSKCWRWKCWRKVLNSTISNFALNVRNYVTSVLRLWPRPPGLTSRPRVSLPERYIRRARDRSGSPVAGVGFDLGLRAGIVVEENVVETAAEPCA